MQQVAQKMAPDPYAPILRGKLITRGVENHCELSGQYRRRADILATTRRVLAQEGHQKFRVRSVSEACNITAQTIHNSFGRKDDLLREAMNQYTFTVDSFAFSRVSMPFSFLKIATTYHHAALINSVFLREFVLTCFSSKYNLKYEIFEFGRKLKSEMLNELARSNLLRTSTNSRIAAEQIAYVNAFAIREWAENDDIHQLYERLIFGNGSILLGILIPEAATDIEKWLSNTTIHR